MATRRFWYDPHGPFALIFTRGNFADRITFSGNKKVPKFSATSCEQHEEKFALKRPVA